MHLHRHRRPRERGFTLVELMIAITVMAILVLAAAPSMRTWIVNTRVRTSAEALQNGLRLAQAEAVRQSRQVAFNMTGTAPNWINWQVLTLPSTTGDPGGVVRAGPQLDTTSGVVISSTDAVTTANVQVICFSSLGNLVLNDTTVRDVTDASCAVRPMVYGITHESGSTNPDIRRLQVQVSISGRVRMCDPDKALSAANPDGCV